MTDHLDRKTTAWGRFARHSIAEEQAELRRNLGHPHDPHRLPIVSGEVAAIRDRDRRRLRLLSGDAA